MSDLPPEVSRTGEFRTPAPKSGRPRPVKRKGQLPRRRKRFRIEQRRAIQFFSIQARQGAAEPAGAMKEYQPQHQYQQVCADSKNPPHNPLPRIPPCPEAFSPDNLMPHREFDHSANKIVRRGPILIKWRRGHQSLVTKIESTAPKMVESPNSPQSPCGGCVAVH